MLTALWELASASAREIHDRVGEPRDLVYTTTAKVLDRLYAKGLVSRKRSGKAFIYEPKVERQRVERERARAMLVHLLGQEPRPAIATLVEAVEAIDPRLIDDLARAVDAHRKRRHGP